MINLRILSGELLNQGERNRAERCIMVSVFLFGAIFAVYFATCLKTSIIGLLGVQMSTLAQSKIEFAAHLIKISSQIGGIYLRAFSR